MARGTSWKVGEQRVGTSSRLRARSPKIPSEVAMRNTAMSIVSPDVPARLELELLPTVNSLYQDCCNLELVPPGQVNSSSAYGANLNVINTPRNNTLLSQAQRDSLRRQSPGGSSYLTSSRYSEAAV